MPKCFALTLKSLVTRYAQLIGVLYDDITLEQLKKNKKVKTVMVEIFIVLFFLIFFPALYTKAPIYLSNFEAINQLKTFLPSDQDFKFLDAGCGTGRVLKALSSEFPKGSFEGIELSPLLALFATFLTWRSQNVRVKLGTLFTHQLKNYDYIYAFLSPVAHTMLYEYLKKLGFQGTLVLNSFPLDKIAHDLKIEGKQTLFLYKLNFTDKDLRLPEKKG